MPTSLLFFKFNFCYGLIFTLISSGILSAQDNFRIFPYLQNPGPEAITILWFSEEDSPGLLTYWQQGSETKINANSIPISADVLAYSDWENITYFQGHAPSAPFRHRLRIENLKPSTTYEYNVTQGAKTFNSAFHTAPDGNASIRFIAYGDPETEPESTNSFTNWVDPVSGRARSYLTDQTVGYQNNLDAIKLSRPDIVFIAGDLVENGGEQRDWDEFWLHNTDQSSEKSIAGEIPIMAALGNHEYFEGPYLDRYNQQGSESAVRRFLTYFESPLNNSPDPEQEGRYYSIKYGPATFIVLDVSNNGPNKTGDDTNFYLLGENDPGGGNAPDFGPGSQQYEWLETKLIKSQIESIFTFIILHHAPYSTGPHGYPPGEVENTDNQSGNPVRLLTPLFMKYGVDAVISGHDEIWERSEITGIETKPDLNEAAHTIHFYDVGTGGDGLREPEEGLDNPYQKFVVHQDVPEVWENNVLKSGGKHYGHLEVDIIPTNINTWQAIMKPVYIFPLYNTLNGTYSDYERRIYDDQIVLTRSLSDIAVPEGISFSRCYPNPFNTETAIEYYLPEPCRITIKIIDFQGKIIRVLDDGEKNSGISRTIWDGKDEDGNTVTAGLYLYRIETSTGLTEIKRMIFLK
jgi:3',5'-cyclic AMP phosphodiesterase CpdA